MAFVPVAGYKLTTTMTGGDLFLVSQADAPAQITGDNAMASLGTAMSGLGTAAAISDTDQLPVAQGSDTLLAQSFSAIWTWATGKFPLFKQPTVGVSGTITLDSTLHNNAHLFATGPVTVRAPSSFGSLGDGFSCTLNANGNLVTLSLSSGIGMISSNGIANFSSGRAAFEATTNGNGGTSQLLVTIPGSASGSGASIQISSIPSQAPTTTFTVSGFLSGYGTSAPILSYKIDSGSLVAITSGTTTTSFSFPVTGGVSAGSHTITVSDANGVAATSNSFTASATPTLTLNAVSAVPPAAAISITGTTANYGTQPTQFDVSFDNGSTWPVTARSNTGSGTSLACSVPSGSVPAAGSYQMKIRDTNSTSVVSNAVTLIVEAAAISSAPTTGTSGAALSPKGNFTLTGITSAWAALWNGTADQGSRVSISGASGTLPSFTPSASGTFTLRIYDASSAGTKLAESANITVSSSVATTVTAVSPNSVGNVGSPLVMAFTYTGGDPTSVQVSIDGGSFATVGCTAASGAGTVSVTPSGTVGVRSLTLRDVSGTHGSVTTPFYAQPAGTASWTFSGTYNGAAPVTPRLNSSGNNVRPEFTCTATTGDTPVPSSTNPGWFAGWSVSQTVPPIGTGWAGGIPTANIPAAASVNYSRTNIANPAVVSFTANPPGPTFVGDVIFAWFTAPSGFAYVDGTAITVT